MWPLLLLCVAIIIEHLMAFAGAKNSPDFVEKNGRPGPKRRFQDAQNACEGALKPARIEIIPRIDTIFFLLVFFPLSSLTLTRLNGVPVELPDAKTAPAQSAAPPTLTIDRA
ncbi:MAG: biopolymer transporter ExbD, partial [Armatimonadetes bacterium]|nr:biopolymer transporter ExbD [Armatimonadota bacterium]